MNKVFKNNDTQESENGSSPFKCDQCHLSFIVEYHLKQHMSKHNDLRPFVCELCPKSFKEKIYLQVHEERAHEIGNYKCDQCELVFQDVLRFVEHKDNAHKTKLKCSYCWRKFLTHAAKEKHEKNKHAEMNGFDTGRNKTSEPSNSGSKEEQKGQHSRKFVCILCRKRFNHKKEQISHYKTFHNEEFASVFKECKICGSFLGKKNFPFHMKAHEGDFKYKCSICDFKCVRESGLVQHSRKHSKTRDKRRTLPTSRICSVCKMEYKKPVQALTCEKRHAGIRDVECKDCGKKLFSRFQLKFHRQQLHKLHKCKMCGYVAGTPRLLLQHKRLTHNYVPSKVNTDGNLSLMCEQCGVFFKTQSSLTFHIRKHLKKNLNLPEQKVHICQYCSFIGKSYEDVIQHCIKLHSSYVHKCEICSFATPILRFLLLHMRKHGEGVLKQESYFLSKVRPPTEAAEQKYFECFLCGYYSHKLEGLKKHISMHRKVLGRFGWFNGNNSHPLCQKETKTKKNEVEKTVERRKFRVIKRLVIKHTAISVSLGLFCFETPEPEPKRESSSPSDLAIEKEEIEDKNVCTNNLDSHSNDTLSVKDTATEQSPTELVTADPSPMSTSNNCSTEANIDKKKINQHLAGNLNNVKVNSDLTSNTGNNTCVTSDLSSKLKSINGEFFLSLNDICSMDNSSLKKEIFQKLLKQISENR